MLTRRTMIRRGGELIATLALPLGIMPALALGTADITMGGRPDGSAVWFEPFGLLVRAGQTVRWTNRDAGNSHTTTAYHPANERSLRLPARAAPWDSSYLLPGDSFSVVLTEPGVYDYYCAPHEHAGMVGRIVVAELPAQGWWATPLLDADPDLPDAALRGFPAIDAIVTAGSVVRQSP